MVTRNLGRQQMVDTFLNSTERRIQVITADYQNYLGRSPDQAGLNSWLNFLANGGSVDALANDILSSQEYFQRQGNTNEAFVQGLYQNLLGRSTSPAESVTWVQALNKGAVSQSQVVEAFFASDEGQRRVLGQDYQQLLGRAIDPAGLSAWANFLTHGGQFDEVLHGILTSDEYYNQQRPSF
jgi:hypothetical protein